jgi:hypothetical protein
MDMKRSSLPLRALALMIFASVVGIALNVPAKAASFTEFTVRPSRVEASITDVQFLIKADAVSTATEDAVQVTFGAGYTVDSTPANVTVSTANVSSWDAECTNTWPGVGSAATGVTGNVVTIASSDLTVGQTYCFVITAGIDNPGSIGNYTISVATRAASADVDSSSITVPIVDDDEVAITAAVAPFVRCDVVTTNGADNAINLGTLRYGTVTSSSTIAAPDNIQVSGGTNATEGMTWYYRSNGTSTPATENGLYSTAGSYLLSGATAEGTLSASNVTCSGANPCYGIYYGGTTTQDTGTVNVNARFTGLTATTAVGPMRIDVWGDAIAATSGAASNAVITYYVNATASEQAPAATDYTDTLIFTCKADL